MAKKCRLQVMPPKEIASKKRRAALDSDRKFRRHDGYGSVVLELLKEGPADASLKTAGSSELPAELRLKTAHDIAKGEGVKKLLRESREELHALKHELRR